jgi:hypothetical protein
MLKRITLSVFSLLLLAPVFLPGQSTLDTTYTVVDVYTSPDINPGDTIEVIGYYTNPDVDILIDFYGDYVKDRPFLPHTILKLTGIQPPADAEDGGYIRITGKVSYRPNTDPFNPEDSLMAYLEALSFVLEIPGNQFPSSHSPGGGGQIKDEGDGGLEGGRGPMNGDCDPCKFAFLLSGGADSANNHSKYWENLVALYNFKVDSLGYCDSNVFVHYFKGDRRDDRIPAERVLPADSAMIDSVFQVIANRVAACSDSNTPATFQKMITNHGASNGDICLLGRDRLAPGHLKDLQQMVIDSCAETVYDEFLQCFGGIVVDSIATLDEMNKATIFANSNANDQCGYSPHNRVHEYLEAKIESLDTGTSYPDAVVNAKLAYDQYLSDYIDEIHAYLEYLRANDTVTDRLAKIAKWVADSAKINDAICKSRNVTIVPFTEWCQWRDFVVPPGGQLVVRFEGSDDDCGNATVYRENDAGERVRVKVWNWNHPGSRRYQPGNETRVVNGEMTVPTTFWIHNDNDTSRLQVEALASQDLPESPSNLGLYPGFSLGGTDSSSVEFDTITTGYHQVVDIEIVSLSLTSVPAVMGPGFVDQLEFTFQIDPGDPFWSNMNLIFQINSVTNPGQMQILSPTSTIPESLLNIPAPGEYIVPLGDFTQGGFTGGNIILLTSPPLQFDFDSWGMRSALPTDARVTVWFGEVSSDWNEPLNWSDGVPDQNTSVIINPSFNSPVITTDVYVKDITINAGANVVAATGSEVIVTSYE